METHRGHPRGETPEKYCEYCGAKLERQMYPSKIEDLGAFKRRKYCNQECMRKAFLCKDSSLQTYRSAHATAQRINNLILKKDRCEVCGTQDKLDIHHIDGNWHNNSLDNLMCLCRSCHMKQHSLERKLQKEGDLMEQIRIRKLTPTECFRATYGLHRYRCRTLPSRRNEQQSII